MIHQRQRVKIQKASIRRELGRLLKPGHRHIYNPLIRPQEEVESEYPRYKSITG